MRSTRTTRSQGWRAGVVPALLAAVMLVGPGAAPARSTAGFGQVQRYLFVPEIESSQVEVIDTDADQVVGALDLGLVPVQVEVSASLAKLMATDGRSASVTVSDLVTGTTAAIPLSVAARRLTLSPDGLSVAVTDLDGGAVAVVDLLFGREVMRLDGLPPLRDLMFDGKGETLYYAAAGVAGIGVIGITGKRVAAPIEMPHSADGGVASLRRSPDGRHAFAHASAGGPIDVIALAPGRTVAEIAATPEGQLFPSGTGAKLILLEPASSELSVLHNDGTERVTLAGSEGVDTVYPAWLDTIAFVPSTTHQRLLVYDLDQPRLVGEIPLPGVPVRGSVTADSQKLYLPLADARLLLVVDARERRVARTIRLAGEPLAALIAGGYGICH